MRYIFILLLLISFQANAQNKTRWYDPLKAGYPVIQNQGWTNEISQTYTRLPARMKELVREPVWNLSQDNAGLAIHFYTNSAAIKIRYQISGPYDMNHMPATGKSGVDLYAIGSDGQWMLHTDKFIFEDTVNYIYNRIDYKAAHKKGYEFRLFLPLYNHVKWMEIGVPDSAELNFIPVLKEKPIIIYGTSIAQGGCASRSGMGWTNIVSRMMDWPVINLAFSGNGPFEKVIVDHIDELDAKMYIFDCLPNMGALSAEEVYSRVIYGVSKLREKHSTPILLTDHIGYRNDQLNDNTLEAWQKLNTAQKRAYDTLIKRGTKMLFYLTKEQINFPDDGCVDAVHPNDLGMQAYANAYVKKIREILHMPVGDITTTIPVAQRREPYIYEWKDRHSKIMGTVLHNKPRNIIIGNSIIHYWNEPQGNLKGGISSWNSYLKDYQNMGFGWDRIENVLWRVYHGALDGFIADKIIVAIGTNNIGLNTDEEIVEGLRFLLKAIKIRQGTAKIKLAGILPRKAAEERIAVLNNKIKKMAQENGCYYIDAGTQLLLPSGKIDESLFFDGLHPNEKGYQKIAPFLAQ